MNYLVCLLVVIVYSYDGIHVRGKKCACELVNSFSERLSIQDCLGFWHQGGPAYVDYMMDGLGWWLHMELEVLMYSVYIEV